MRYSKAGTNPRGVEFSKIAITKMTNHQKTMRIKIRWDKEYPDYDVYERWIEYWSEN